MLGRRQLPGCRSVRNGRDDGSAGNIPNGCLIAQARAGPHLRPTYKPKVLPITVRWISLEPPTIVAGSVDRTWYSMSYSVA